VWDHVYGSVATPSACDFLYLSMYPLMWMGLVVRYRSRVRAADTALRVDGLIVGLAAAALYSYMIEPVARAASGGVAAVVTEMAYPVGDLLLASLVLAFLASLGWRLDRFTLLFAVGCGSFCVADSHYLL